MIRTVREFLDFSGPDNKRKFIASIWLGALEAFANALKIPAIMYILMGLMGGGEIRRYITGSLVMMIVSIAVSIFAKKKSSLLQTEAGYGCCAFKRIEMAEHLRFVPMGYFADSPTGEVTSVITNTMDSLSNIATRVIMVSTQGILETLLVLAFLFIFDVRIGLVGAAGTVIYLLVNTRLQSAGSESSERKNKCDREMAGQIVEDLKGIAEIRNYGLAGAAAGRFDRANEACRKANTDMELKYDPWLFVQGCVLRLTGAAIVAVSVYFYLNGSMDLIIAIGMTICAFILFSGLEMYGGFSSLLHLVQGYMDQANEVLALPTMEINGKEITPASETIEFKDVDFSYDDKKIIDALTLTIPEGKTTAIVGPSGGGKTTLARLAARFWDVDRGSVSLGGVNVKEYSLNSLMRNYSFVFQSVYLFSDTIENNIKFGKEDASHEEVVRAARLACCDDFIGRLPDGYDTVIGEGGASLSGGEKQRLSIARAIMKDSPVIILDEATANVDPENEEELMRAIDALTRGKTVIMIAHRLKTVRNADNIVVIDKGRIADQGRHDDLIAKDGIYRNFIKARQEAVTWRI